MTEPPKFFPPAWMIAVGAIGFLWMSALTWTFFMTCIDRTPAVRPYLAAMSGPMSFMLLSDQVLMALITMVGSILGPVMLAILAYIISKQGREIAQTKATIITLEENTNSIKDALVKVTAESEFARGLKMGIEAKTASASLGDTGMGPLIQELQSKALKQEGVVKGMADEKNRATTEKAAGGQES